MSVPSILSDVSYQLLLLMSSPKWVSNPIDNWISHPIFACVVTSCVAVREDVMRLRLVTADELNKSRSVVMQLTLNGRHYACCCGNSGASINEKQHSGFHCWS